MRQKSPDPPSPRAVLEAIHTGVGWSGNENRLKGWHKQMKVIARKAHPNLCEVLEPRENRLQQNYVTARGNGDSNVDSHFNNSTL